MLENLKDKFESKTAVVLFNLGGPDALASVRPFLYNLFSDKFIISLPYPVRNIIAYFIAKFRAPVAQENYQLMGGKSPLLAETNKQKEALERQLKNDGFINCKVFVSMRYWHPFSSEILKELLQFMPKRLILLPLYPQFSITTSASSIIDFKQQLKKTPIDAVIKTVCCYSVETNFITSHIKLLTKELAKFPDQNRLKILFSAHSLPKKIIASGDPYQWQIEQTVAAIMSSEKLQGLKWEISYQSKVGPVEWLTPSTEDVITKAARDKTDLLIVPVAFVSEHIETLVELDIEYARIVKGSGIRYHRVPALGIDEHFISSLSSTVHHALSSKEAVVGFNGQMSGQGCPVQFKKCLCLSKRAA